MIAFMRNRRDPSRQYYPIDTKADGTEIFGRAGDDLILGNIGVDRAFGDEGDDTIIGAGAEDLIYGGDGNDLISGGADYDFIFGGRGNDTMYGGDGGDVFLFNANGFDPIQERFAFNDAEIEGFDLVYGEKGDDLFAYVRPGALVYGGAGNDVIVDAPFDPEDASERKTTFMAIMGTTRFRALGPPLFMGTGEPIPSPGMKGPLYGGQGDDTLGGGAGDDVLIGNANADALLAMKAPTSFTAAAVTT